MKISKRRLVASSFSWSTLTLIVVCELGLITSKLGAWQDPAPTDKSAASSPKPQDQKPPAPQDQKPADQKSTEEKPADQKPPERKIGRAHV